MATLNGTPFENPLPEHDGSLGDAETGPYAKELQQQRFLPPPGDYWVRLPDRTLFQEWAPARVDNARPLGGFAMIALHHGETRKWDLSQAEWVSRAPFSPVRPSAEPAESGVT